MSHAVKGCLPVFRTYKTDPAEMASIRNSGRGVCATAQTATSNPAPILIIAFHYPPAAIHLCQMRFSVTLLFAAACLPAQVRFSALTQPGRLPDQFSIEINGQPFAVFHSGAEVNKPYLAPLRSASGKIVTRRFPMESIPGESHDHLHHTGLWFSYDDVNGVKLWENHPTYTKPRMGRQVVRSAEWKN